MFKTGLRKITSVFEAAKILQVPYVITQAVKFLKLSYEVDFLSLSTLPAKVGFLSLSTGEKNCKAVSQHLSLIHI